MSSKSVGEDHLTESKHHSGSYDRVRDDAYLLTRFRVLHNDGGAPHPAALPR